MELDYFNEIFSAMDTNGGLSSVVECRRTRNLMWFIQFFST